MHCAMKIWVRSSEWVCWLPKFSAEAFFFVLLNIISFSFKVRANFLFQVALLQMPDELHKLYMYTLHMFIA